MVVDSTNIDLFWLEGESRISPVEQIDFLYRFFEGQLPVSDRTASIMKRLMVIEQNQEYSLSGKTGWSIRNGHNNGWFVGYIETAGKVHFFVTNVNPKDDFNMDMFARIRKDITSAALAKLGIIDESR